jgi:hypothetical protein
VDRWPGPASVWRIEALARLMPAPVLGEPPWGSALTFERRTVRFALVDGRVVPRTLRNERPSLGVPRIASKSVERR